MRLKHVFAISLSALNMNESCSIPNRPHGDRRNLIRLRRLRVAKIKYLSNERASDPFREPSSVLQYCSTNDAERDRARKDARMSVSIISSFSFRIGFVGAWFKLNCWLRSAASVVPLLTVFVASVFPTTRSLHWVCESYEFVGSFSLADHVSVEFQLRK